MTTTGRLPRLPRFGGWHLGSTGGTAGSIGTVVQSVATQYDGDSIPVFVTTSQLNADGTTYRTSYVRNCTIQCEPAHQHGELRHQQRHLDVAAAPGRPAGAGRDSRRSQTPPSWPPATSTMPAASSPRPPILQVSNHVADDSIQLSGSVGVGIVAGIVTGGPGLVVLPPPGFCRRDEPGRTHEHQHSRLRNRCMHLMLSIGSHILRVHSRNTDQRLEITPIDVHVRMRTRSSISCLLQ